MISATQMAKENNVWKEKEADFYHLVNLVRKMEEFFMLFLQLLSSLKLIQNFKFKC